ncbi:MAG: hypothetical protein WA777_05305 [Rhodanobacter sp.]
MKFETLMLHSLFAASMLVCGLIFVAMLNNAPQAAQLASNSHAGVLLTATPSMCVLPPDGVVCPRPAG